MLSFHLRVWALRAVVCLAPFMRTNRLRAQGIWEGGGGGCTRLAGLAGLAGWQQPVLHGCGRMRHHCPHRCLRS